MQSNQILKRAQHTYLRCVMRAIVCHVYCKCWDFVFSCLFVSMNVSNSSEFVGSVATTLSRVWSICVMYQRCMLFFHFSFRHLRCNAELCQTTTARMMSILHKSVTFFFFFSFTFIHSTSFISDIENGTIYIFIVR